MTIAITGATGQLGRHVVAQLAAKIPSDEIVALVRSPDKAIDLCVSARAFDYSRPDLLASALEGIDTLLLISSSEVGKRITQHGNVIAAAKTAGVGRIVYTSLLHADTSALDLAEEHLETEAALKASGVPFTILRNGWYTENYLGSLSSALEHNAVIGSAGDGRISSAARGDYAAAAVIALTRDDLAGRTIELAGDDSYTLTDLAAEISRQSGSDVRYVDMPETAYAQALVDIGLPSPLAHAIAGWDAAAAKGALFDDGRQLSALIGRPTTPLSDVVAAALR
ncbi:SDR family oxidoreductase [Sphingomonas aliaeris]|uniref:SDR family oxidoreductase n=1 Tax=Sphingomonas aliaeris TaxID=2759526 RepID=A0A974S3S3_9SPHN|nr:SDR family oxidoreductase [Sphingomonas aliaeris]QQV76827.1 SDR family oxidoreductase [Sphingomonas aliaeris]